MAPTTRCLAEQAGFELPTTVDVLKRALKNRRTATGFYAAAALKWLDRDIPDTASAAASLHAMVEEVRCMDEIIRRIESSLVDQTILTIL